MYIYSAYARLSWARHSIYSSTYKTAYSPALSIHQVGMRRYKISFPTRNILKMVVDLLNNLARCLEPEAPYVPTQHAGQRKVWDSRLIKLKSSDAIMHAILEKLNFITISALLRSTLSLYRTHPSSSRYSNRRTGTCVIWLLGQHRRCPRITARMMPLWQN